MNVRELIMNRGIPLFLCMSFLCTAAFAQSPQAVHPQAIQQSRQNESIYKQQLARLAPSLRNWVILEGSRLATSQTDLEIDGLRQTVRTRLVGQDFSGADIDALVQLLAMEIARQADEDLREMMAEMQASNERKKALRESTQARTKPQMQATQAAVGVKSAIPPAATDVAATEVAGVARPAAGAEADLPAQLDSLSELGDSEQLRMQMAMDRRAKALETLSNVMKKSSDTAATITSNLK